MKRYVYGDESGDFNFSAQKEASKYFILTTVTVNDHILESILMQLRREIAWEGWGDVRMSNSFMKSDMWSAATSPLLQVADYCAWAVQRKWERNPSDTEAYDLIQVKIASEFGVFRRSAATYY